jgi:hypothetical protein
MTRYEPLFHFLNAQSEASLTLSFADVERIIAHPLPVTAGQRPQWWANETSAGSHHVQCHAWRGAGYDAFPDLDRRTVIFRRRP